MKLFGLKDENGKEYVIEADLRSCFHNIINVMPIEPTPKFKVGDWIISKEHPQDGVVRISEILGNILYFIGNSSSGNEFHSEIKSQFVRLATSQEIEKHLVKLAEKKGFKEGVKYYDAEFGGQCKMRSKFHYYYNDDAMTDGCGGWIYYKGEWATIIPDKKPLPKTKEEFMNFLGTYCNRHCKSVQEFLDEYED